MVDPKFNELPVAGVEGTKKYTGTKTRQGLSINDTIAADANKSVGAGGVDTSNITAGFDGHDPSAVPVLVEEAPLIGNEEIALRAFELWNERGRPIGSPEVDWKEAEQDLLARSRGSKAAVSAV